MSRCRTHTHKLYTYITGAAHSVVLHMFTQKRTLTNTNTSTQNAKSHTQPQMHTQRQFDGKTHAKTHPHLNILVLAHVIQLYTLASKCTHTHTHIHSGSSRRGGGGVIGPYLCLEPQQSPRLLSAPPLSLSESVVEEEEEEDSNEDWPPSLHQPALLMAPVQTHMLAHTHHQLVMRAEMKCLSPESPEEAELSCCGTSLVSTTGIH